MIPHIPEKTLEKLRQVAGKFPEISEIILFGSRALGTHKETSDIDILITGDEVTTRIKALFMQTLEESTIPYFFDILLEKEITNENLRQHIEQHGVSIYASVILK